jgi:hypothetical protein
MIREKRNKFQVYNAQYGITDDPDVLSSTNSIVGGIPSKPDW